MILRLALRARRNIRLAFVGAGGKTTAMFQLARQLEHPVILTTSTHLGIDQASMADRHYMVGSAGEIRETEIPPDGVSLFTGSLYNEHRLKCLDDNCLGALQDRADADNLPLLIEADGSHCMPLKAPAEHEPAIPAWANYVVNVAGLSGIGKPLTPQNVHRWEIFSRLSNLKLGDNVNPEALCKVLAHPEGGLKNIPKFARKALLLNQADTETEIAIAEDMAQTLKNVYDTVVVAALNSSNVEHQVHSVHEPVAGIVLAGGASTRMGQPKILLEWKGIPLIRWVVVNALAGGLWPVVVVLGAVIDPAEEAIKDLPVVVVKNIDWKKGQSTSVIAGLHALPANTGGAIFLLADQPYVPELIIRKLIHAHSLSLSPIIAPYVGERRANPVLFDQHTFPALMKLTGDTGGRILFQQFSLERLSWPDDRILLDIDTVDDYHKLKDLE